jgi:hypothetical protein
MSTAADHLRADLLARLEVAAGLAETAASRLAKAKALDAAKLSLALGDMDQATALLRQLLARRPREDDARSAVDGTHALSERGNREGKEGDP